MNLLAALREAMYSFVERVVAFLPSLVVVIVLLAVGWLVSRLLAAGVARLLRRMSFDTVMDSAGWTSALGETGVDAKPSKIVSRVVFWIVFLLFAVAAVDNAGIELTALPLRRFLEYLPRILGAVVLLFLGSAIAGFAAKAVGAALARIEFAQHRLLSGAVRGLLLLFTFMTAIEQLGFDVSFLTETLTNLLTLFAAALAVTFALGGRDVARNLLAGYYARERFTIGDVLVVDGEKGELTSIGNLTAELRLETGALVIPNKRLIEAAIHIAE